MTDWVFPSRARPPRKYVRAPEPLVFPESDDMPETGVHLEVRTALYLLVRDFVGARGAVGSEQFLYWDPSDPRQCLAPDVLVRLGATPGPFRTWKVWERGAPHLAVEIISEYDVGERVWAKKLAAYRRSGVVELVRFEPEVAEHPLRLWDRIDGDLVERELEGDHALLSDCLGVYWCVQPDATLGWLLRLSRDARGAALIGTALEERVAELEAELRRRPPA